VLLAIDKVIIKLTISQHFKMDPTLVTDGDTDQTVPFITSTQCVEAVDVGWGPWTIGSG
jgi:hypothetical protein